MSAVEMREEVHQMVEALDDRFLKAIHSMISVYQASDIEAEENQFVSYDVVTGKPLTASELTDLLDKEVEAARGGEYITIEDLRKESDQWLASIK